MRPHKPYKPRKLKDLAFLDELWAYVCAHPGQTMTQIARGMDRPRHKVFGAMVVAHRWGYLFSQDKYDLYPFRRMI